jgi:hypothetical protein
MIHGSVLEVASTTLTTADLNRLGLSVRHLNSSLYCDSFRAQPNADYEPNMATSFHVDLILISARRATEKTMRKTNFKTLKSAKRMFLAALAMVPMLLNGCAQTGTASKQSNVSSANPAMYNYNPATRDFETRWPFGPANYH